MIDVTDSTGSTDRISVPVKFSNRSSIYPTLPRIRKVGDELQCSVILSGVAFTAPTRTLKVFLTREESHLCNVEVISKKNRNETSMIVKLSIRDPDLVKVIQEISDRDPTLLNLHFLSDEKSELIVKCAVD